jgi:predicted helicase
MSGQDHITTFDDVFTYMQLHQRDTSDKGDLWERVCTWFLRNDPEQQQTIGKVWRWNEKANPLYDGHDSGIDIVAEYAGEPDRYRAIQCKNYAPDHKLSYEDLATFFGKAEADDRIAGLIIATVSETTTDTLKKHALSLRQRRGITTVFLTPTVMADSNVDWSALLLDSRPQRQTFDARPHQRRAIKDIMSCFESHDRCKAIMACGTGKTLMSLRLSEAFCPEGVVLFAAPSIALVAQAMRAWTNQARHELRTLVVCSDAKASKAGDDTVLDDVLDLAFPANTNPCALKERFFGQSRLFRMRWLLFLSPINPCRSYRTPKRWAFLILTFAYAMKHIARQASKLLT